MVTSLLILALAAVLASRRRRSVKGAKTTAAGAADEQWGPDSDISQDEQQSMSDPRFDTYSMFSENYYL